MAVMDVVNRFRTAAQFMREQACAGLTKADLQAAVDATDNWIDANAASYNAALPQPARSMSVLWKTILFCKVALRRAGLYVAEED